mgnify:CR=1 FL=1
MGKLKEKYLRDAFAEYEKRLSAFCRFRVIEIDEERLPDKPSEAEIKNGIEKEADRILKKIPENRFLVSLCVEGKMLSSEELAGEIHAADNSGTPFTFIIGSSHGLAEQVKRAADIRLSFSKMTFPHQLFRVMLSEQIYRAEQIINGGKYHK